MNRPTLELPEIGTWSYQPQSGEVTADPSLFRIFGLVKDSPRPPLSTFLATIHREDSERVSTTIAHVVAGRSETFRSEYRVVRPDGVRLVAARGYAEKNAQGETVRLHGLVIDITDRQRAQEALAAEKAVLEAIARDASKEQILDLLCRGIEAQSQKGMLVSALVLERSTGRLLHGAGPSLPEEYNRAIDGLVIGDGVGSCGTAAFTAKPVLVEDISQHPYWASFKDLAAKHGLASCSSFPITSSQGQVLGTLAMYYPRPYMPTDEEMHLMRTATYLAGIVMERAQERGKLRQANEMLTAEKEAQIRVMHHLRAANRAVSAIISCESGEALGENLLQLLVSTFGAKAAGVWSVSSNANHFELVGEHGFGSGSPMLAPTIDVLYTTYKPGWVARYGQPFAGSIAPGDLQFDDLWLQENGVNYAAIYPLTARGRTMGILAYFGAGELPVAISEVLATVGAVAGLQLLNLRR